MWRKNGLPPGDYNVWRTNFGEASPGGGGIGGQGVPEPAAFVLLAIVAACTFNLRRHHKPT
jgi:hypothetical protein